MYPHPSPPSVSPPKELVENYSLTEQCHEKFIDLFGDNNPIHTSDEHAKKRGFPKRVIHGAQLNGLLSHFVGVVFPAQQTLIMSVDLRYARPCHPGDELQLTAKLESWNSEHKVAAYKIIYNRTQDSQQIARGRLLLKANMEEV